MKLTNKGSRLAALTICLILLLAVAAPAMAATNIYATVTSATATVYSSAAQTSSVLGTFSKDDILAVEASSGNFYKVRLGATSSATGYVLKTSVSAPTSYIQSGKTVASIKAAEGSSAVVSGETKGVIANVKKNVNFRKTASTKGAKWSSLKLNQEVVILGEEGDFYKISAKGKVGYVAKDYVRVTGAGSGSATGGAATGGTGTGKVTVGKGGIAVVPSFKDPSAAIKTALAAAKKKNSDVRGYISVPGTNVQQPILYRSAKDVHYYASRNINKASDKYGTAYMFYDVMARNNVVTAHNMRGSNGMFHQLHHLQEKALGYTTCQTTDYKCAGADLSKVPDLRASAAARVWEINLHGYNKWEVWAMYETPANEPASTLTYNYNHLSNSTPAQVKAWIDKQKSRSEIKFTTDVSTDDIFLTIYTCGTNYDNATAQSRLYFFLKAIG